MGKSPLLQGDIIGMTANDGAGTFRDICRIVSTLYSEYMFFEMNEL